jgi:hypothetical protein
VSWGYGGIEGENYVRREYLTLTKHTEHEQASQEVWIGYE